MITFPKILKIWAGLGWAGLGCWAGMLGWDAGLGCKAKKISINELQSILKKKKFWLPAMRFFFIASLAAVIPVTRYHLLMAIASLSQAYTVARLALRYPCADRKYVPSLRSCAVEQTD